MKFLSILAVLGFLVVATCEAVDVEKNLVVYFPFDEGKGDEVLDISPNGFVGTLDGAKWVDGVRGKALEFDGASRVLIEPIGVEFDTITLECWLKPADKLSPASGRQDMICTFADPSPRCYLIFNRWSRGEMGFHPVMGNDPANKTQVDVTSDTGDWNAEWYHIAVTQDSTNMLIYINGVLDGETDTGKPPIIEFGEKGVAIGGRESRLDRFLKGSIDEVRIWDVVLTEQEIQEAMENLVTAVDPGGNLVTLWSKIKSVGP